MTAMHPGDRIEVKVARYDARRGRPVVVAWRPATVVGVTPDTLRVRYADTGQHERIPTGQHRYRRARVLA